MQTTTDPRFATQWRSAVERPKGLAKRTRSAMRDIFLDIASHTVRQRTASRLQCLCCHYVFDDQLGRFRQLLLRLKQIGRFVSTEECLAMTSGEANIEGLCFHLSFDDGFENVFSNALPVLEGLEIPAACFVASGLVAANFESSREFCIREKYSGTIKMATWDQLRSCNPSLFTIGSHTRTHRRLANISGDPRALDEELVQSKNEIEEQLQRPCTIFAWPGGQAHEMDHVAIQAALSAGYEALFAASGGAVRSPLQTMIIPRQHFEVEWPWRHLHYLIHREFEPKLPVAGR